MTPSPTPERWSRARFYEWDLDLPRPADRAAIPSPALDGTTAGPRPAAGSGHPSHNTTKENDQ